MPARLNLSELGSTIADGTPIDWDSIEKALDPGARGVIRQLRLVERIAQAHAVLPPAGSFTESLRGSTLGPPEEGHTPSEAPTAWGPLTIIERIGRGTFGDVYRARDPRLDRPVALKLLRRDHQADDIESTVIEEGRLAARVKHPNVVTVYGAERINGRVGLWMEFIDGRTLEEELRERGPLPPREVATIGLDLCRALEAIHRLGLLHRDVKAQNVMRDRDGRIVLTDFGSGRDLADAGEPHEMAGTPLYLAPEVVNGTPTSAASDVYSVGVLLYHLSTGAFPVQGPTLAALRDAHSHGLTVETRQALDRLGTPFASIIRRAIAPDPTVRYANAADIERDLRAFVFRRTTRVKRIAVATAAVAIIGIGGLAASRMVGPASQRLAFKPRDLVLITRFDNRTGEPVFDGAIEYALERELTASDTVGLVPRERVDDALQLMKRPVDTIVNRAVGREVCLRDGHIKALLAGRVEKFGTTYVLTTTLIDPADDSPVTTLTEDVTSQDGIVAGLHRQATAVRLALGEARERLRGPDPSVEPGATRSLRAFQLYNQSYQLGREGQWPAALEIARRVVAEDPEFASGWVWLAWSIRNTDGRDIRPLQETPRLKEIRQSYRPFLDRAMSLINTVSPWERYWIEGSVRTLTGDHEAAVPLYQALLRLRPDHHYGANNLENELLSLGREDDALRALVLMANQRPNDINVSYSAASGLLARHDIKGAQTLIDRVRHLLDDAPITAAYRDNIAVWLKMIPVYLEWDAEHPSQVRHDLVAIDHERFSKSQQYRNSAGVYIGWFYLALGRPRDAAAVFNTHPIPNYRHLFLFDVADVADDLISMRKELGQFDSTDQPMKYLRAGLVDDARRAVAAIHTPDYGKAFAALAEGDLAILDHRATDGISILRQSLPTAHQWSHVFPDYLMECVSLGNALSQAGDDMGAIQTIEKCTDERPGLSGTFMAPFWMRAKIRLADLYRRVGRLDDAERQEREVRALLSEADPDHPLLRHLDALAAH